jgi:putative transposase
MPRRPGWAEQVNAPQSEAELARLRRSLQRGCPFGDEDWTQRTAERLNLEITLRPQGRPRKKNGS